MTPGHHVVVVIGLVTAKLVVVCAHCCTQQMLALSLYGPQALVHSILASSIKPVAPHKSIPGTELVRPVGFTRFTRALSRSRKLSEKREK